MPERRMNKNTFRDMILFVSIDLGEVDDTPNRRNLGHPINDNTLPLRGTAASATIHRNNFEPVNA